MPKETLHRDDVIGALRRLAADLPAQAEALRELDAAIGDGDLGITMTIGFGAVTEALPALESGDLASIIMKSGMAFNRKAASTFGALFATMMMRAAGMAKGKDELRLEDLAAMAAAAAQGVMERGKAAVGDKTLLDALVPAAEALSQAAGQGKSLAEGLERAAAAAQQGAEITKGMKSKMGRASWFADRTEGVQDPGATAVAMMLKSLAAFAQESGGIPY